VNRVELAAGTVTYRAAGPADSAFPPVVFVHGLLVDAQLWTAVADLLAERGIRSYAPTWPLGAHPLAMHPDADLSPRGQAAIIHDFLAALELTDVTLVGNDTGGALCQFLIDTDHRRVGRLVLTNCDAFDVFPPPEFAGLLRWGRYPWLLKPVAAALRNSALRHGPRGFGLVFTGEPDAAVTRSWIEPLYRDGGVRRDAAKLMGAIRAADLLDVSTRLGLFPKPVHLVWGDADRFFPLAFAQQLAAAFPNTTLTTVEGGRTFVPMDFPGPVADAIRRAHR